MCHWTLKRETVRSGGLAVTWSSSALPLNLDSQAAATAGVMYAVGDPVGSRNICALYQLPAGLQVKAFWVECLP